MMQTTSWTLRWLSWRLSWEHGSLEPPEMTGGAENASRFDACGFQPTPPAKEEQMESGGGAQTTRGQRQKECITFHC